MPSIPDMETVSEHTVNSVHFATPVQPQESHSVTTEDHIVDVYLKMCSEVSKVITRFENELTLEKGNVGIISFTNIPWTDVVYPFIFVHLSWKDLFRLRRVNKEFRAMVTEYFKAVQAVDLTSVSQRFTCQAFELLTADNNNIRILNLSGCKWLSTEQLLPVIERNTNLTVLDISSCFEVSNLCLQRLATKCKHLTTLKLKECHWVNAAAITAIACNNRQIEDVDLTSCWELTDEAAIELIIRSRNLRIISLSKIYGITDHVLFTLASHAKQLQFVNVSGCWRITDYGIRMLGEYCLQLRQLVVGDCRDVSEDSLAYLRKNGVQVDVPSPLIPRINLLLRGFDILRLQI